MKTWWNILIWMWIGVSHGADHVNGGLSLTGSPTPATDGQLYTMICAINPQVSAPNIAWLLNNESTLITQYGNPSCTKQQIQTQKYISINVTVNCNDTYHSIEFIVNSTEDRGSNWQCAQLESNNNISRKSNVQIIDVARPAMSTQTTTRHTYITLGPETVTSTGGSGPKTLYIVVGAVGGAVLLIVAIVGIVCIRRRRQATHQQNDMKEERNVISTPVYQNSRSCYMMENELYETSRDVSPINEAGNQEDDSMLSDAYACVDIPATNMCTPREQVASGDVNLEDL